MDKILPPNDQGKRAAGFLASTFVKDDMIVGIGTGSTVAYFLEALAIRCSEGLKIKGIATSRASEKRAIALKIPLIDDVDVEKIDLAIDGADEIDEKKNMIKGGGGALLREKLVATAAKKLIIIVDESKVVPFLGTFPLPLEIVSFLYPLTIKRLNGLGYEGKLRLEKNGKPFITDNRNYIYDLSLSYPLLKLEELNCQFQQIVGVVETGLFLGINPEIIVGTKKGSAAIFT